MNALVLTCEVCGAPDAQPYYTKKLKEVKKGEKQPTWRCAKHQPKKVVRPV